MAHYLLRIEAVNFANFLADTADLSTVRGGGLLLLDAPDVLTAAPKGSANWHRIFAGASTALFEFDLVHGATLDGVVANVEDRLHTGPRAEATIMVNACEFPKGANFQKVQSQLINDNRRRQLQTPSFIYPRVEHTSGIDEIEDRRPGFSRAHGDDAMYGPKAVGQQGGRPMVLSDSVFARRKYGLEQKRSFYSRVRFDAPCWEAFPFHAAAEPGAKTEYVNDLQQLADYPGAEPSDLNGKIALIYLDGNKFGEIARNCGDALTLEQFSGCLRANQDSFLNWLMRVKVGLDDDGYSPWHWSGEAITNSEHPVPKRKAFRIETLLWGGDEIIWIVPAWCGWWVLASFFEHYGKLPWDLAKPQPARSFELGGQTRALTNGAAIVFCHQSAPIRRIQDLAKHLAEGPKNLGKSGAPSNYKDFFTYQVLESFDHLGTSIDEMRKKQLPKSLQALDLKPMILSGTEMLAVPERMERFRKKFPRSKLHWLTHLIVASDEDWQKSAEAELERAGAKTEFNDLMSYFGAQAGGAENGCAATWLHIAELWDYTHKPNWEAPPAPTLTPTPAGGPANAAL